MKKNSILLLFFGIHLFLYGQVDKKAISPLPLPFEKVNLVTDRDIYLSGETIWFHATISLENNQESVSHILYIELFNAEQRSIVKKKYKINKGLTAGALDIPYEFLSDAYYIRAYTHYDKNFPVEKFFITAIQIINPKKGIPIQNKSKASSRAIDSTLNAYAIQPLLPREGMQLASVKKINKDDENSSKKYSLDLLDYNQNSISKAQFSLHAKNAVIAFPDSTFKNSGLYFYLLKNQQNKILNVYAFIFKNPRIKNLKRKLDTSEFTKRESVSIDLNKYYNKNSTNLGVKIVQKGSVLSAFKKLEYFMEDPYLLMSYLTNQFNPLELSKEEQNLSLIALNKILNREEYKSLFNTVNVFEQKWIPGLKDIGLSGIALDKISHKPLSNLPIYLSIFDNQPQIHVAISKEDGSFKFPLNSFEKYKDALLCPLYKGNDEVELKVNRDFIPSFQELKHLSLNIDSTQIDFLEQMLISSQTTKQSKLKSYQQDFDIQNLPYSFEDPDLRVILDDYIETPTLEMVFKELVPKVRVRKKKNKYALAVFDTIRGSLYTQPLVILDEVPIYDIESLLKIPPKAIEKIEVHTSPFIMEQHIIYGIIKISTLTDNFAGMNMNKSARFFKYQTISPNYIFSAKEYDSTEKLNSRFADFRTLLYWNPLIKSDADKMISFYTSDQTGEYEVYIFGDNKNGHPFHSKVFEFEVKE